MGQFELPVYQRGHDLCHPRAYLPLARSSLSLSRNDGGRGEVRVAGEGRVRVLCLARKAVLAALSAAKELRPRRDPSVPSRTQGGRSGRLGSGTLRAAATREGDKGVA